MTSFRIATSADLVSLHALVERGYRGDAARTGWTHEADLLGGQRTDIEALGAAIADPAERIVLAEREGALTGCVQVTDKGDATAYLGLLAVDPASQAGGLGRALIAEAERLARCDLGARVMEMTVIAQRAELIAYYERRGYAQTGETRPFPLDDPRFGIPKTRELHFVVMAHALVP